MWRPQLSARLLRPSRRLWRALAKALGRLLPALLLRAPAAPSAAPCRSDSTRLRLAWRAGGRPSPFNDEHYELHYRLVAERERQQGVGGGQGEQGGQGGQTGTSARAGGSSSVGVRASQLSSDWFVAYRGASRHVVLRDLRPGQCVAARVRARNALGASPWTVLSGVTRLLPIRAGGRGPPLGDGLPSYVWDQSAKEIKAEFLVPATLRKSDVQYRQDAASISLRVYDASDGRYAPLLEGRLHAEVREPCGVEWTFAEETWRDEAPLREGHKWLLLSLEKRHTTYRVDMWPRLLQGHPEYDVTRMRTGTADDGLTENFSSARGTVDRGTADEYEQMTGRSGRTMLMDMGPEGSRKPLDLQALAKQKDDEAHMNAPLSLEASAWDY